jgi:glycosyltransferase involved in cell wall biosynthesis
MIVLLVHNRYQLSGGEDAIFAAEAELLRRNGHDVVELVRDNKNLRVMSKRDIISGAIWSRSSRNAMDQTILKNRPDVVHFHNTFPIISPSCYEIAKYHKIPVVQTLHNYRMFCPSAVLFRDGHICHDCVGRTPPWPSVLHGCYRDSRSQSALVATMLTVHRMLGTWTKYVDRFIALSEFSKNKFIDMGIPPARISVKFNFLLDDPRYVSSASKPRDYMVFVGRLTEEKGILTILNAWMEYDIKIPLKIAGDGPLAPEVSRISALSPFIEYLGYLGNDDALNMIRNSCAALFPALWYECCPLAIIESFACGVPAIASRLGAMEEMVNHGRTGLLYEPGDALALRQQVMRIWHGDPETKGLGSAARLEYQNKYTADTSYNRLLAIYQSLLVA